MQSLTMVHAVRIPEDMALVGYDDIDFVASAVVPLTSVRRPPTLIDCTAIELLAEELKSPGRNPIPWCSSQN